MDRLAALKKAPLPVRSKWRGGGDPVPRVFGRGGPRFVPARYQWVGLPWVDTGVQRE